MTNSITVAGHEVQVDQGEYEDFDDDGNPVIRPTGRSAWWCSCGAGGTGPNADTAREIGDHLGIDENGEMCSR